MTDDDPPSVPTEGVRLLASAMGETSGQCAAFYFGIDQQCPNDGVVFSSESGGSSWTPFPLCANHAAEWATCQCGGEEAELQFHRGDICTDSLEELERQDEADEQPDQDSDWEDIFAPS